MFGHRFTIMKVAGIPLRIDLSWFIIFFIVAWSLAVNVFPRSLPQVTPVTAWIMGFAAALGLFVSVVLHEYGHAAAARRRGIEMDAITLFIFGGVAEMRDDPPDARSEFAVAIAGPLVTVVLAVVFAVLAMVTPAGPVATVLGYLAVINGVVLAFNLIPAFPLDGGRVLRAALWAWRHDLRWATSICARAGVIFAFALFGFAIIALIGGNFIGAMWWFFLGLFLQNAARASYQQVLWKQVLSGVRVGTLMHPDPRTAPAELALDAFTEEYVYRYPYKMFPVVVDDELLGCVNVERVREIPAAQRVGMSVSDVMESCDEANTIETSEAAIHALRKMVQHSSTRLMAVRDGRLAGVIAMRDLMNYVARRIEFEDQLTPQA